MAASDLTVGSFGRRDPSRRANERPSRRRRHSPRRCKPRSLRRMCRRRPNQRPLRRRHRSSRRAPLSVRRLRPRRGGSGGHVTRHGRSRRRPREVASLRLQGDVHEDDEDGHLDGGPMTAAKAAPLWMPKLAMATGRDPSRGRSRGSDIRSPAALAARQGRRAFGRLAVRIRGSTVRARGAWSGRRAHRGG